MFCLHGRDGDARTPFDEMRMPDIAAQAGVPLAFASLDGGANTRAPTHWRERPR